MEELRSIYLAIKGELGKHDLFIHGLIGAFIRSLLGKEKGFKAFLLRGTVGGLTAQYGTAFLSSVLSKWLPSIEFESKFFAFMIGLIGMELLGYVIEIARGERDIKLVNVVKNWLNERSNK